MAHTEAVQYQISRLESVIAVAVANLHKRSYTPTRKDMRKCVDCLVDIVDEIKPYIRNEEERNHE
ncbi:MAG: hypothetical protein A4E65_02392 [Syntrophorhabdus sp. PtaU1.Bin153]|nr:MAG: hypothetical protein A4E65_02392 [Syntrophorhabdus sp. PtaU1.Bin153]